MNLVREAVKVLEKKGAGCLCSPGSLQVRFRSESRWQYCQPINNPVFSTTRYHSLARATGIKLVHHEKVPKAGNTYPDGLVRIDYKDMQWDFAIQAKARLTRAIVAMEKTQPTLPGHDRILVTEYATPPMADLMKEIGLLFMDTAGNAYINKPPLYIFIKGNKRPENLKPAPIKRLFKPAGLKVVFTFFGLCRSDSHRG